MLLCGLYALPWTVRGGQCLNGNKAVRVQSASYVCEVVCVYAKVYLCLYYSVWLSQLSEDVLFAVIYSL